MSKRFDYVKYDEDRTKKLASFRIVFGELEAMAFILLEDNRYRSLFLSALEVAYMWVGKSLRDEQIEADKPSVTPDLRERSNS